MIDETECDEKTEPTFGTGALPEGLYPGRAGCPAQTVGAHTWDPRVVGTGEHLDGEPGRDGEDGAECGVDVVLYGVRMRAEKMKRT